MQKNVGPYGESRRGPEFVLKLETALDLLNVFIPAMPVSIRVPNTYFLPMYQFPGDKMTLKFYFGFQVLLLCIRVPK
jgi:hypothetical protein